MLTLEERERRAYITNCPTAPALAEAVDRVGAADDELRHENDFLKEEVKNCEARVDTLEQEAVDLETKIETLEHERDSALSELATFREKFD